ncbi:hypothetical protein ACJX0J_038152, partial [Zea mays]
MTGSLDGDRHQKLSQRNMIPAGTRLLGNSITFTSTKVSQNTLFLQLLQLIGDYKQDVMVNKEHEQRAV